MAELVDVAEFTSTKFKPLLPDDCQVNPGVYGAELAYWLCGALAAAGVVTSYPNFEDWGWYLEYFTDDGSEFALHCGNVDGSDTRWLLGLRAHAKGLLRRERPSFELAAPLTRALAEVLQREPAISELAWHLDRQP